MSNADNTKKLTSNSPLAKGTPIVVIEEVVVSGGSIPFETTGRLVQTFEDDLGTGAIVDLDNLPRSMGSRQRLPSGTWAVVTQNVDRSKPQRRKHHE